MRIFSNISSDFSQFNMRVNPSRYSTHIYMYVQRQKKVSRIFGKYPNTVWVRSLLVEFICIIWITRLFAYLRAQGEWLASLSPGHSTYIYKYRADDRMRPIPWGRSALLVAHHPPSPPYLIKATLKICSCWTLSKWMVHPIITSFPRCVIRNAS